MKNLEWLDFAGTPVSDLSPLSSLDKLFNIRFSETKITDIFPIKYLENLHSIDISDTNIHDLNPLKTLPDLGSLVINDTKVEDLTPLKEIINYKLYDLVTWDINVKYIPKEIYNIVNCVNTLRAYWQELETAQATTNNQLKIMFLGNGCVGKTTLLHWFLNKEFTPISLEDGRTHGIFIKPFHFKESDMVANFWDFGGQEVFHATHRLFLGRRSLYILVWATESPEFNDDLKHPPQYWLDMIADTLGSNERCRVLIVQNQFGDEPALDIFEDNAQRLAYKEMGLDIETHFVNAKTGAKTQRLLRDIEDETKELIDRYKEELPSTWVNIRKTVAERRFSGEKQLSLNDFEAICRDCQLTTPPSVILDYLHRAGELFYYGKRFGGNIILDQEWALKAVYAILKRDKIELYKGRIRREQLIQMWQNDSLIESPEEAEIFLNFMLANKTAFYTEGGYSQRNDNAELVIPQLLPTDKPEMYALWEDMPNKTYHRIAYQFLHRDIIERFIVQTAHLSDKKEYWRNGLFINHLGSKAVVEVVEIEGKKQIQIECVGAAKQELLTKIREEFNKIRTLEKAVEYEFIVENWVVYKDKIHLQQTETSGLSATQSFSSSFDNQTKFLMEELLKKSVGLITDVFNNTAVKKFTDDFVTATVNWIRPIFLEDDRKLVEKLESKPTEELTKSRLMTTLDDLLQKPDFREEMAKVLTKSEESQVKSSNTASIVGDEGFIFQGITGSPISITINKGSGSTDEKKTNG